MKKLFEYLKENENEVTIYDADIDIEFYMFYEDLHEDDDFNSVLYELSNILDVVREIDDNKIVVNLYGMLESEWDNNSKLRRMFNSYDAADATEEFVSIINGYKSEAFYTEFKKILKEIRSMNEKEVTTTYSVETIDNEYNDDLYNGSLIECIRYIRKFDMDISPECRIAKVVLDSDGTVIDTLEIISDPRYIKEEIRECIIQDVNERTEKAILMTQYGEVMGDVCKINSDIFNDIIRYEEYTPDFIILEDKDYDMYNDHTCHGGFHGTCNCFSHKRKSWIKISKVDICK